MTAFGLPGDPLAEGEDAQHLIVAEMGRLDRETHPVGEGDHGDAEIGQLAALHHLSGRTEIGVGPGLFRLGGLFGRRRGRGHRLVIGRLDALDRRRRSGIEQGLAAREDAAEGLVDLRLGHAGRQPLEQVETLLRRFEDIMGAISTQQTARQIGGAPGGRAVARRLPAAPYLHQLAVDLGLGEAVALGPAPFADDPAQAGGPGLLAGMDPQRGDVGGLVETGAGADTGADEGRRRALGQIGHALVEGAVRDMAHQPAKLLRAGVVVGNAAVDPGNRKGIIETRLGMGVRLRRPRRHLATLQRRRGRPLARPAAEPFPDLRDHRRRIDVTGDHQRGPLGPVPAVIEGADLLRGDLLDILDAADRGMVAQRQAAIMERHGIVGPAALRRIADPLLGEDHVALGRGRALVDLQLAGDLAQQQEGLGQGDRVVLRQVELVDRIVVAGLRVGVGAQRRAEALHALEDIAILDVGRAAESHMFEIMGEARLALLLHHRTGVEAQAEGHLARRHRIVHHRVAQAVRQFAEGDVGIGGKIAFILGPAGLGGGGGKSRNGNQQTAEQNKDAHRTSRISYQPLTAPGDCPSPSGDIRSLAAGL